MSPPADLSIRFLPRVDSTNAEAWRAIDAHSAIDGLVIAADEQSAGRGQHGHVWHSPRNLGLYASIVSLPRDLPAEKAPALAPLAAQAVLGALADLRCLPPNAVVKPPNDILVDGKKLCGVLIETRLSAASPCVIESIVAGFGLNLSHAPNDFPPDLRPIATSLALLGKTPPPKNALLYALAAHWQASLRNLT